MHVNIKAGPQKLIIWNRKRPDWKTKITSPSGESKTYFKILSMCGIIANFEKNNKGHFKNSWPVRLGIFGFDTTWLRQN